MKMRPPECPPVVGVFYFAESPIEHLIEVALEHSGGTGTGARALDRGKVPEALKQHFHECLASVEYEPDPNKWRYWIGVVHPGHNASKADGWAKGFPHTHQWDGMTCVHYIQEPESGGDTVVMRDDGETVLFRSSPEVKKTSVLDGWSEHGVESVLGETSRMTVIATGFRK